MKHSEVAAKLAIEGAVSAIGGQVRGELGLQPRVVGSREKAELGIADDGQTLYYDVGDSGVLFHTDGAFTTIWYPGADCDAAIGVLEQQIKRSYPDAKRIKDEDHATEPGYRLRTYDIRLPHNHLAIVDAIYPSGRARAPKFLIRVTAMARQN